MKANRKDGLEQPGIRWGPFTLRIPLYHTRLEVPEFFQGFLVASATALALIPLLTKQFDLTFEEAVGCAMIHAVLINSAVIVFGEPLAPGWVTPALPLALTVVLGTAASGDPTYATAVERFQVMTAVSLNFAVIVLFMGLTGFGRMLFDWLPATFKAGIVMGAALAAVHRVFLEGGEAFDVQPISTLIALAICLFLTFSIPFKRLSGKYRQLAQLSALGLLPGFLAAALIGPLVGELDYEVQTGFLWPPFLDLWSKVSPFAIGWPSLSMFVETVPLALMGYVILYGDLITGIEVLKTAIPERPDERIDINLSRSHYSLAIRNALMALAAPFFPTQGSLWTGVHVIIVKRWGQGRTAIDSLFGAISSYYLLGIPVGFLVLPIVTALEPLMPIALALTLTLTGFACAYVAIGLVHSQAERGATLLIAFAIAFSPPWVGMAVAVIATVALVGFRPDRPE